MTECENLRVGREFLASVSWPSTFDKPEHNKCYCDRCYSSKYEDTIEEAGYTYVIPRGWTRYGVHIDEVIAKYHGIWKAWVHCYHGTSIENAKSIIEHRQLLLPSDTTMNGKKFQIRKDHIPGEYFFFTTPSIRYAGLDCYACTYEFTSSQNSKYNITVALQCKQKPGSFIVQPETVGAEKRQERICPHIPNSELEWKTENRGAIIPYALLLRVERCHNNEDHGPETREVPPTTKDVHVPMSWRDEATSFESEEYQPRMTKKRIAVLILLFLLTFPPAAALAIGQMHKADCPIQPSIPLWMIIYGVAGLSAFSFLFCTVCIAFKCCSNHWKADACINGCIVCLLICLLLALSIIGSLWIFPTRSKVQFNQPNGDNYCQENLYLITFGITL